MHIPPPVRIGICVILWFYLGQKKPKSTILPLFFGLFVLRF
jgi:hypothetical protein